MDQQRREELLGDIHNFSTLGSLNTILERHGWSSKYKIDGKLWIRAKSYMRDFPDTQIERVHAEAVMIPRMVDALDRMEDYLTIFGLRYRAKDIRTPENFEEFLLKQDTEKIKDLYKVIEFLIPIEKTASISIVRSSADRLQISSEPKNFKSWLDIKRWLVELDLQTLKNLTKDVFTSRILDDSEPWEGDKRLKTFEILINNLFNLKTSFSTWEESQKIIYENLSIEELYSLEPLVSTLINIIEVRFGTVEPAKGEEKKAISGVEQLEFSTLMKRPDGVEVEVSDDEVAAKLESGWRIFEPVRAYKGDDKFIFLSYPSLDKGKVYPIIKNLNKLHLNLWFDEGIPMSVDYRDYIDQKIEKSWLVLIFLTPNALGTKTEETGVEKELFHVSENHKKYILIHLEITEIPSKWNWKYNISRYTQAILKYKMDNEEFYTELLENIAAKEKE